MGSSNEKKIACACDYHVFNEMVFYETTLSQHIQSIQAHQLQNGKLNYHACLGELLHYLGCRPYNQLDVINRQFTWGTNFEKSPNKILPISLKIERIQFCF